MHSLTLEQTSEIMTGYVGARALLPSHRPPGDRKGSSAQNAPGNPQFFS